MPSARARGRRACRCHVAWPSGRRPRRRANTMTRFYLIASPVSFWRAPAAADRSGPLVGNNKMVACLLGCAHQTQRMRPTPGLGEARGTSPLGPGSARAERAARRRERLAPSGPLVAIAAIRLAPRRPRRGWALTVVRARARKSAPRADAMGAGQVTTSQRRLCPARAEPDRLAQGAQEARGRAAACRRMGRCELGEPPQYCSLLSQDFKVVVFELYRIKCL